MRMTPFLDIYNETIKVGRKSAQDCCDSINKAYMRYPFWIRWMLKKQHDKAIKDTWTRFELFKEEITLQVKRSLLKCE